MEQLWRALAAVKEGKGVNVSEKRKAELEEQFSGNQAPPAMEPDLSLIEDVGKWTDMAEAWIKRL